METGNAQLEENLLIPRHRIAKEAQLIATELLLGAVLGNGPLASQAGVLEAMESRHHYMMLMHRFGNGSDSIYLGPRLRNRLGIRGGSPFFRAEQLVAHVCPLELNRVSVYYQHFHHDKGTELMQMVQVYNAHGNPEWLVAFSVRVRPANGSPMCVLTLFRPLNDLLALERTMEGGNDVSVLHSTLTTREREVLALVASGLSSTEIGLRLHISPLTVKTHRQTLMSKLRVGSVAGLVRIAVQMGM